MTIDTLWNDAVRRHANLPALGWFDQTPWTFTEVDRRVGALRARWRDQGLAAGDRVALWAPNHPGWGVVYLATTTAGLVIVPVLPDFTPAEAANVLVHGGVKLLVVGRALAETWARWLAEGGGARYPALANLKIEVLEDLVETPAPETAPASVAPHLYDGDLAALIYTSGTTGASKGVMLTHGNITSNVVAAAPIVGYVPGDRALSILPLAHTYECTLGFLIPMHEGVHIGYLARPASPTVLLPALAAFRPHSILTVPLFMEKIYRAKVRPGLTKGLAGVLSRVPGLGRLLVLVAGVKLMKTFGGRIKFFGVGGAPLAPEVAQFLFRARFPYAIGYGLTETSPLVAGHLKGRLYTTGRPLRDVQVRIAEPRNELGTGEIQVKGPNVMAGYYRDEGATSAAFTEDGWFRTGDLGLFDSHGHLQIRGRSKNLILGPSGENIYPEAVEALLNQDRLVSESLVLQRGQEIVAKVFLNEEALRDVAAPEAYLAELKHQINLQLARFSRLSHVEVQAEPFEKTATLKIKRYLYA